METTIFKSVKGLGRPSLIFQRPSTQRRFLPTFSTCPFNYPPHTPQLLQALACLLSYLSFSPEAWESVQLKCRPATKGADRRFRRSRVAGSTSGEGALLPPRGLPAAFRSQPVIPAHSLARPRPPGPELFSPRRRAP